MLLDEVLDEDEELELLPTTVDCEVVLNCSFWLEELVFSLTLVEDSDVLDSGVVVEDELLLEQLEEVVEWLVVVCEL